jgi:sodium-dependent dicarboxylate transporter 2/3/5
MPDPAAPPPAPLPPDVPDVEPSDPGTGIPFDRIGLIVGPAAMMGWLAFTDPAALGLTAEAHRLFGVLLLTILWWLTEPIPIPATGLLAVCLCVFIGAVPKEDGTTFEPARIVLRPFADPSVFFLLGGTFIGRAMQRHGLDRRLALSILCTNWAGRSPGTLLAAVGLSVMLVSMWISNTAATTMVYPVTMGIISVLAAGSGKDGANFPRSAFATALLLMTAYASSVGGITTPIGTATNVVAIGYFKRPEFRETFGGSIDFFRWVMVGAPMMATIFAGLYVWLRAISPAKGLDMPALRQYLRAERDRLGPWAQGEINTIIVFAAVVLLWVTPAFLSLVPGEGGSAAKAWFATRFPEEMVAVMAPVLLFLLPTNWKQRKFSLELSDFGKVDWGTSLLFGAGLSLGSLMFRSGLAGAIGQWAFDLLGTHDVWAITALAIAGGVILSEFTSNAATAATLIPVVLAICSKAGVDPVYPLMGVTFGASFGSALPVSTPPNAIVYGSGLIPVRRMIAAGIGLDVVCITAIWLVLRLAGALGWRPAG